MATPTKTPKKKSRYKGDRKAITVVLDGPAFQLAQEYFALPVKLRGTRHSSVSSMLDAGLSAFIRKNAAKIRKAGLKVPESVFE